MTGLFYFKYIKIFGLKEGAKFSIFQTLGLQDFQDGKSTVMVVTIIWQNCLYRDILP